MSKNLPSDRSHFSPSTRLVYVGREPSQHHGFVNTPIYRGSTVLYKSMDDLLNGRMRYTYGTHGTPTIDSLTEAWSELSKAAGTVLVPSGLAAIAVALMSCLKAGDHLLMTDSVYQPTRNYCNGFLKRFGIETTYYDPLIGQDIEKLFRPNTTAVFTESPGSQTFEIQDIPAIAEVSRRHGATVLMDNTWATPLLFSPHEHGVDIAIEAGTKYLSGASDLLLGMVSANERSWKALYETWDSMALCAGPEDVFLGLRGLRTMALRLKEQGAQALELAKWLEQQPEVARVLHPALENDPGHTLWKRDFTGSSGLFSIELKPVSQKALANMLDNLQLFGMGYSWGGFESLVIPFDCTKYRTATAWNAAGPMLRIQVGLEDLDDLKRDFLAGLKRLSL